MTRPHQPSRRELMAGQLRQPNRGEAHVCSFIVHVREQSLDAVRARLLQIADLEIPAEQGGKLVVTLETASDDDIVTRMNQIQLLPGVLSAALVFHHVEPGRAESNKTRG